MAFATFPTKRDCNAPKLQTNLTITFKIFVAYKKDRISFFGDVYEALE